MNKLERFRFNINEMPYLSGESRTFKELKDTEITFVDGWNGKSKVSDDTILYQSNNMWLTEAFIKQSIRLRRKTVTLAYGLVSLRDPAHGHMKKHLLKMKYKNISQPI